MNGRKGRRGEGSSRVLVSARDAQEWGGKRPEIFSLDTQQNFTPAASRSSVMNDTIPGAVGGTLLTATAVPHRCVRFAWVVRRFSEAFASEAFAASNVPEGRALAGV